MIFDKATKVNFKTVDDLASVWCQYVEMELRHENYDRALQLMQRATAMPSKRASYYDKVSGVHKIRTMAGLNIPIVQQRQPTT